MVNRKHLKRSIFVYLIVLLVAIFLIPTELIFAKEDSSLMEEVDPDTLSGTNWMSKIPGARLITEINLPGTHDSGTKKVYCADEEIVGSYGTKYAVCQDLFIPDQLNAGIRFLDIRLSTDYDKREGVEISTIDDQENLWLVHGDWQWEGRINARFFVCDESGRNTSFADVLQNVSDFLAAHPTETVILNISKETGDSYEGYIERVNTHLQKYYEKKNPQTGKQFIYDAFYAGDFASKDVIPKLEDCRGQFVLLSDRRGEIQFGSSYKGSDNSGSQDTGRLSPVMYLGDQLTYFENHYESKYDQKRTWLTEFYKKFGTHNLPLDANEHLGFANYVQSSSNVVGSQTPHEIASAVNQTMFFNQDHLISKRGVYYGWILSDFVSELTARCVWQTNYPEHVHKMVYKAGKEATCTENGTHLYYECSDCGKKYLDKNGEKEITDMADIELKATGHTPGEPLTENVVPATFDESGSYDLVTYCDSCKKELERKEVTIPAADQWTVPYLTDNDVSHFCKDYQDLAGLKDEGGWKISDGWYTVQDSLTLSNRLHIDGNVNLILCDGATATFEKGIHLYGKSSLTIWCQEKKTGKLIAKGEPGYAGIGGDPVDNGGSLTIHGGTIEAVGGENAAGIGGGYGGDQGGDVTIYDGTVTATGGANAAGIGGGAYTDSQPSADFYPRGGGYGGNVTIYDGIVTATGGVNAAGIGGGYGGHQGGAIIIKKGNVIATGGTDGAGIGGGAAKSKVYNFRTIITGGKGGNVTIQGGDVIATGNGKAGGIGNGRGIFDPESDFNRDTAFHDLVDKIDLCGKLTITGGKVTAIGGDAIKADQRNSTNRFSYVTKKGTLCSAALTVDEVVDVPGNYSVSYGDDRTNLSDVTYANKNAKTPYAKMNRWAVIEPCVHSKGSYYITPHGHTLHCENCFADASGEEVHHFTGSEEGKCNECGFRVGQFDVYFAATPDGGNARKYNQAVYSYGTEFKIPEYSEIFGDYLPEELKYSQSFDSWVLNGKTYLPGEYTVLSEKCTFIPKFTDSWKLLQNYINDVQTPDVQLNKDYSASRTDEAIVIPEGKNIVLDLNGFTLDRKLGKERENGSVIVVKGNLTIIDSKGGGKITGGNSSNGAGAIVVQKGASLDLQAGLITGNKSVLNSAAIVCEDGSNISVSGTVQVTGNKSENKEANILLNGDVKLKVPQILKDEAKIGITMPTLFEEEGSFIFTEPINENAKNSSFVSDDPAYVFGRTEKEEIVLGKPVKLQFSPGIENVTDSLEDVTLAKGSSYKLDKSYTTTSGRVLTHWFDGKNEYPLNTVLKVERNMNLIAFWGYSLTFNPGEGSGSMEPLGVPENEDFSIPACGFTAPEGKTFIGWKKESDGCMLYPGSSVPAKGNMVLTAVYDDAFVLWIGDTEVTYKNCSDIFGDGTASFDPKTSTLRLNDFSFVKGLHSNAMVYAENMILNVTGEGSLYGSSENKPSKGIHVSGGSVVVDGKILVEAENYGIYADNVTVNSGDLRVSVSNNSGVAIRAFGNGGTVQVRNGVSFLSASGGRAILASKTIELGDQIAVKTPEKGTVSGRSIVDASGQTASSVVLETEAPHQHILQPVKGTAPTCKEAGTADHYKCIGCDKVFKDAEGKEELSKEQLILPAAGHTPSEPVKEKEVPATCTEAGSYELAVYCSVCEAEISRETVNTKPLGHHWNEGEITKEASCTLEGVKTNTCETCKATKEEVIQPKGHAASEEAEIQVLREPTCTNAGLTLSVLSCKECGEMLTSHVTETPALGHRFGEWTEIPATCETDGSRSRVCTVCEMEEKETIPALEHAFGEWTQTKAPSCTEEGEEQRICSHDSSHIETRTVEALGHEWGEWTVTTLPTEQINGEEVRVCKHDETHTETRAIPALEHQHVLRYHAAVKATCTEEGSPEYWICKDGEYPCGRIFVRCEDQTDPKEEGWFETEDPEDEEKTVRIAEVQEPKLVIPATGHKFGEWTEVQKATCTEEGKEQRTCAHDPTHIETRSIPAVGHEWDEGTVTKDPSCTEKGVRTFYCKHEGCSETRTEEIEALGHTASEMKTEQVKEATCEEGGTTKDVVRCSTCNEIIYQKENKTAPLGHLWDEGKVTTEPGCTTEGIKTFTCQRAGCTHTKEETVPVKGHSSGSFTNKILIEPTCTRTGYALNTLTCKDCGEVLTNVLVPINALGHEWSEWQIEKEVTCEDDGVEKRVCSHDPSHVETRVIASEGHQPADPVRMNEIAATCTTDGSYDEIIYCTYCKEEISRTHKTEKALGHRWGEWTAVKEATCEADGTTERVCQNDPSHKETKTVSALGHKPETPVKENEKEATCKEGGSYDMVVYCRNCEKELSREHETTAALGHRWDSGKVTKEATCTLEGEKTYTCQTCSETKTEPISPKGHHASASAITEEIRPVSCTESGLTRSRILCRDCGETLHTEIIETPAKGHNWSEWTKIPATYDTDGSRSRTCSVCKLTETEILPALKHHFDQGTVIKEPSCTEEGIRTFRCTDEGCDATYTERIAKTEHQPDEAAHERVIDPTCEKAGSYTDVIRCKDCKEVLYESDPVTTAPLGHDWDDGVLTTEPGCTTEGIITYTCKRADCGHTYTVTTEPKGHSAGEFTKKTIHEASCTRDGYALNVLHCSDCNEVLTSVLTPIPAIGHDFGEWTKEKDPTCTEEGLEKRICSHDEAHVETRTIAALGHTAGDKVIEKEKKATCEEAGSYDEVVYCSVCKAEISRSTVIVPALGHSWIPQEAVWVDDFSEVTASAICEHDPSHVVKETVKTVSEIIQEPNETEDGTMLYMAAFTNPILESHVFLYKPIPAYGKLYYCEFGADSSWTKTQTDGLKFVFKRTANDETTFRHFTGIKIDDKAVDPSAYKAEAGSVIIWLQPEYLETLTVGNHKLTALFDDGSESVNFSVTEEKVKPTPTPENPPTINPTPVNPKQNSSKAKSPKTADSSQPVLWMSFMIGSLALMIILIIICRKEKSVCEKK